MVCEFLKLEFCLRCGKPVYNGHECGFCGYDLQLDANENSPPEMSLITMKIRSFFPRQELMKAARITLLISLILGSMILGLLSYGIGGKEYFDSDGNQVYSVRSKDEYETSRSFRSSENFYYGFLGGIALLTPIFIGIYMSVRREWIDQKKLKRFHPWNIWIIVNTIIATAFLCTSVYSFDQYAWGRMGFGETLLVFVLFYYVSIIPTAGTFGFFLVFHLPRWHLYGIVGIIGTYSVFISGYYHYRYIRKQRENWILEFIQHCSGGSEISIHEMGLVFLLNPEKMRVILLKMIKKERIRCVVQNWMLNIIESYGSEFGETGICDLDSISESIIPIGLLKNGLVDQYSSIENESRSSDTDYCFRCGNPLQGKAHCPLCGYRSQFSYYSNIKSQYSRLTSWVSSLHGGIDPMRNTIVVLIAVSVGFTFLVGGISYLISILTEKHVWGPLVEFMYGVIAGALLAPFVFIPIYMMVRKEIEQKRPFQANQSIMIVIRIHLIVTLLILGCSIVGFIFTRWSTGLGECTLGTVLIFYLSVISGGISARLVIRYGVSEGSVQIWVGLILLIATYLYYGGMVYAWSRRKQELSQGIRKRIWKSKKDDILKYLASNAQIEDIPFHVIGRIVRVEPIRVRFIIRQLIFEGQIQGVVSEYHLVLHGVPTLNQ